jgi:hypothetical protein
MEFLLSSMGITGTVKIPYSKSINTLDLFPQSRGKKSLFF